VRKGLSLVEVLVALAVLGLVSAFFVAVQVGALRQGQAARGEQKLVRAMENLIEDIRGSKDLSRCAPSVRLDGVEGSCAATPCAVQGDSLVCDSRVDSNLAEAYKITVTALGRTVEGVVER